MHIFILQYIDIHLGKLQRPVCDLTGIMVNKGNHLQMALIHLHQVLSNFAVAGCDLRNGLKE